MNETERTAPEQMLDILADHVGKSMTNVKASEGLSRSAPSHTTANKRVIHIVIQTDI